MAKKQKELPGFEETTIKEIADAAEEYQEAKERRMKLTEEETAAKAKLAEVMAKHKKKAVVIDGIKVWVEKGEDQVKTKRVQDEADDD